ncbi:restriction endonuclease subunit S [Salinisphaera sp. P385]|uniref:Restriction endonuclease subunit S n=1 Tax=Spectribacter acetivorans TaxID=3075603 RepID=A0ABU3BAM4_9GAMM|nr:restriction endonuclease subunit S [Salinisphaera sp. P385]MDT0618313.1 restriction endonuclease subunit S [Salinisphaera sp. P385]
MKSEWPTGHLGDNAETCLGKMLDAKKNRGVLQPYLGNANVQWGQFNLDDLQCMRFEPDEEARYSVSEGDLIVCEGGEPGRCAIWHGQVPNMKLQKALHRVRVKPSLDNYFLYYWLNHAARTGELEVFFTGTTIKHLTGRALRALQIPLPPIEEQKSISTALRALDEKIANNGALAANLESIARAVFKSWFVDFDPVRAKMEGREPEGMDPEIAALFPDRLVESELGLVPKGWNVRPISNLCEIVGGATPSTKEPEYWENGEFAWATPKDLANLSVPVLRQTARHITYAGVSRVSSGLLPPGTVLLSSRAPIGYLAINTLPAAINQGFIAMKPSQGVSNVFLLYWAQASQDMIVANANGSTFQEISKKSFRPLPVIAPPQSVMGAFDEIVRSLFNRVAVLEEESAALAEARDALLPRLISGMVKLQ